MIIFKPPHRVEGAPNLSKGMNVFQTAVNMSVDKVITVDNAEEPIYAETILRLKSLHDEKHVESVLSGKVANGYGTYGAVAFAENMHSVHSCAIMREAALVAIKDPSIPVFAPVSGFHHAGIDFSNGYCTFNGLVLAAMAVHHVKPSANILIIDGDGHYGDGTDDFVKGQNLSWLGNCSLAKNEVDGDHETAMEILRACLCIIKWDLVIYQAGADSHEDDPYMSGYLTDGQWDRRDSTIFAHCKDTKTPIVFNLAGGYNGTKTISLHNRTVSTARQVYGEQPRGHLSPLPSP
jgi:acetoin utilization deacetylase AcuC-like enzyme